MNTEPAVLVKGRTGLTRIPLHMLEYVEVYGRTIVYHIINGVLVEETGAMARLEQALLGSPQFVKPHRAYIVNLDRIDVLGPKEIRLFSGAVLPVSKANYTEVKTAYIARSFRKGGDKECSLR